jgi:MYXO-CTERM domain-containing protein
MADVNGDGLADVAVSGIVALPIIVAGNGDNLGTVSNNPYGANSNSDDIPSFVAIANGSFGDLDNDGIMDLVWGGAGLGFAEAFAASGTRVDFDHHVGAWNTSTLGYLPGFPQRADDHQFFMNPAIADVDGDDKPEVLSGSGGYYIRAWNADGEQPEGWPKFTGGWVISAPAVGDLDGDGMLEVAAANREGYLYVWNTTTKTDGRVDWASFHHDDCNTGNYLMPIGFGTLEVSDEGGCGCRSGRGAAPGSLILVLVVVVGLGRRRRRR